MFSHRSSLTCRKDAHAYVSFEAARPGGSSNVRCATLCADHVRVVGLGPNGPIRGEARGRSCARCEAEGVL